ncbi:MAG: sialidase family protein [Planctomycetia bacterium]|nr:sialidase family protein [Planctomycetia bacterium]
MRRLPGTRFFPGIPYLFCLAIAVLLPAPVVAAGLCESTDVYTSGQDGYKIYRIPTIETMPDGTLLALAEARKHHGGDPGFDNDIDLVYKLSKDAGKTWSAMVIMEDPGENWSAANAATVVDRDTGRTWVLYIRSKPSRSSITSRPKTDDLMNMARWSADNGQTWSEPIDLTAVARDMNDAKWKVSVVGPGGMVQTKSGRLVAPLWGSFEDRDCQNLAIYSDDHGKTWQRGEFVTNKEGGDENQLVELADGSLLMDCRQIKGETLQRWFTTSTDGGKTWSAPRPGIRVSPVATAIERYALPSAGDQPGSILWTGPKGPDRNNLVLRVSRDEGKTFPLERLIAEGPAAYSDLTVLKDKTVGVFWERGDYKYLTFTRFDREFIDGASESKPAP